MQAIWRGPQPGPTAERQRTIGGSQDNAALAIDSNAAAPRLLRLQFCGPAVHHQPGTALHRLANCAAGCAHRHCVVTRMHDSRGVVTNEEHAPIRRMQRRALGAAANAQAQRLARVIEEPAIDGGHSAGLRAPLAGVQALASHDAYAAGRCAHSCNGNALACPAWPVETLPVNAGAGRDP